MINLPRKIHSKDPNLGKILNHIISQVRAAKVISSLDIRASETANGTILEVITKGGGTTTTTTTTEARWG